MEEKTYAIIWLLATVILKGIVPTWLIAVLTICSILIVTVFNDMDKEKGTSHRDAPDTTN